MVNRVEKYRFNRFGGVCSEWLCMAFQKMQFRNLENTNRTKKKSTLAGALVYELVQGNGAKPLSFSSLSSVGRLILSSAASSFLFISRCW